MVTQWFRNKVPNEMEFTHVGTVDESDAVKRKFYLTKMVGQVKKAGYEVKTVETDNHIPKRTVIDIFIKVPSQKIFKIEIWVHPKNGGDDYKLFGTIKCKDKKACEKEVQRILKKEGSHIFNDYCIEEQ